MIDYEEKVVSIGDIKHLLDDYEIEVESPDGWVGVNYFVEKGDFQGYRLVPHDGSPEIICNEGHLFQTPVGWVSAKEICTHDQVHVLTRDGFVPAHVEKMDTMVPIVDINVDHENHRYYTENVSSHNTGVGKSLFMCHMAAAAIQMGKNVLYITMEMAEERIAERIDANLLGVTMDELKRLSASNFMARIEKNVKKLNPGKLIIKEYPTASAHSGHFEALLSDLAIKRNFVPQIIFIDYLNICASSRVKGNSGANSYTVVKSIAEELRGLAGKHNLPVVTATQATRGGYKNTDLGLDDTSESFGLPATADFMFALMSSEELEENGLILAKQLKNRYSDPGRNSKFVLGVDRSRMRLFDAEESAQSFVSKDAKKVDDDTPAFDKATGGKMKNKKEFGGGFNFD